MSARPRKKAAGKSVSAATLDAHYERRHLDRLWRAAPFVLRITDWKKYPAPVLVSRKTAMRPLTGRWKRSSSSAPARPDAAELLSSSS